MVVLSLAQSVAATVNINSAALNKIGCDLAAGIGVGHVCAVASAVCARRTLTDERSVKGALKAPRAVFRKAALHARLIVA